MHYKLVVAPLLSTRLAVNEAPAHNVTDLNYLDVAAVCALS